MGVRNDFQVSDSPELKEQKPVGREMSCFGQGQLSYLVTDVPEAGACEGSKFTEALPSADTD